MFQYFDVMMLFWKWESKEDSKIFCYAIARGLFQQAVIPDIRSYYNSCFTVIFRHLSSQFMKVMFI